MPSIINSIDLWEGEDFNFSNVCVDCRKKQKPCDPQRNLPYQFYFVTKIGPSRQSACLSINSAANLSSRTLFAWLREEQDLFDKGIKERRVEKTLAFGLR